MSVLNDPALSGSRLDRLLDGAVTSRLHLAMVLVGRLKMDARAVLDLRWAQVDLDQRVITARDGLVGFSGPIAGLFHWHAVQQRLDAWRTPRWPHTDRVFVNAYGAPINTEQADATVAYHCRKAGLPVVPLAGLRHPIWAG